ncbi:TonB-dependent receptor [Saprospira sp. CCB-QB6]|uniref:TonB-dependent receptor n=1 Tax=Saprospira sp. CCB-QB6 TaxID=3023936 RepID=UPI00234AF62D|nr:TonB-dependent receptor [Saprospira sp. CCB-QB6]WCL82685.1 TonB-dependent receptor [Saprospira sp. CCB-QB6]
MNKLIPYFFLLLVGPIWGQSLSEPAVFQHYFKDDLRAARLYTDAGLGKRYWLSQNYWFNHSSSSLDNTGFDHDGAFGHLLTKESLHKLLVDLAASPRGEIDLGLELNPSYKNWDFGLRHRSNSFNKIRDSNKDGWQDQAQNQSFYFSQSLSYTEKLFKSNYKFQFLQLEQQTGQTAFLQGDTTAYGQELKLQQKQFQIQHLIAFRKKDLLLLDFKYKDHQQLRNWGQRQYSGKEDLLSLKGRYEYQLSSELDAIHAQLEIEQNQFDEHLDQLWLRRREQKIGAALGISSYWGPNWLFTGQLQWHYHNLAKLQASPQIKINYLIHKNINSSFFTGRSWRFANPLTEYAELLRTGRTIQVETKPQVESMYYYGCKWQLVNFGQIKNNRQLFSDYYYLLRFNWRQQFVAQEMLADLDEDPYVLHFHYLEKGQWGLRNRLEAFSAFDLTDLNFHLSLNYVYRQRWSYFKGEKKESPLYSRHNLAIGVRYTIIKEKKYEYKKALMEIRSQLYLQSSQRLPSIGPRGIISERSPQFSRWDLRLAFFPKHLFPKINFLAHCSIYFSMQQLLNNQQPAYYGAEDPFSPNFEGGYQWGSYLGRRFIISFKYGLSKEA